MYQIMPFYVNENYIYFNYLPKRTRKEVEQQSQQHLCKTEVLVDWKDWDKNKFNLHFQVKQFKRDAVGMGDRDDSMSQV